MDIIRVPTQYCTLKNLYIPFGMNSNNTLKMDVRDEKSVLKIKDAEKRLVEGIPDKEKYAFRSRLTQKGTYAPSIFTIVPKHKGQYPVVIESQHVDTVFTLKGKKVESAQLFVDTLLAKNDTLQCVWKVKRLILKHV